MSVYNLTIAFDLHLYLQLIKAEYPECANSSCCWFYQVQQNIVAKKYSNDEVPSLKFYRSFVIKIWYCYDKSIYINNYWQLLWSVVQVYVQKVGILGAQTIYAFDATYYLANHGSLERSVNLVLQGFIHRYTHFRMHIVFSLHYNSFAYIEEKTRKLYVHPNWKHLSTLDSKPFCLGRLPPWYWAFFKKAKHDKVPRDIGSEKV